MAVELLTRGVLVFPSDLSWDWPAQAKAAGLTTVGLCPTPSEAVAFVRTEAGQRFLEECRALGLEVEYEMHAGHDLLPRDLFEAHPELFRMNETGERVPDWNFCVHSPQALEIVAERAVQYAQALRPTTGRYFYWGDDAKPWCACPQCRGYSDSEQALIYEHHLLHALRAVDPRAQLAHLAYYSTMEPPRQLAPEPGIFLEYAPIRRRYDLPYTEQPEAEDPFAFLEANLAVFDPATAQVTEYWIDVSRFSGWERPAKVMPWHPEVMRADVAAYAARGIRHITSFGAWIDAEYVAEFGKPPLCEYGDILRGVE